VVVGNWQYCKKRMAGREVGETALADTSGLQENTSNMVAGELGLWRVFECKFWSGSFGLGWVM